MSAASVHGVLVVDKPRGPTSHDVVGQARKLFGTREVGHAGTLDPMATGVLVLLFGEATKLSAYLTLHDKRYRAVVSFGRSTDTHDAEGNLTEEREVEIDPSELERALAVERARSEQLPPLFSAISVGGERAHRVGRRGGSLELPPRPIEVRELRLIATEPARITLELVVSKGYYVRALARDLGQSLGAPAHLAELRRLASGPFTLDDAAGWPPSERPELIALAAAARRALPTAELTAEGELRARQGRSLTAADFARPPPGSELCAWLAAEELVALGQAREPESFVVVRGFRPLSER